MKFKHCLLIVLAIAANSALADGVDGCSRALEAGDAGKAVVQAREAVHAAPNKRDAYLCLGRAAGELSQHEEALTALQAAEKLSTQPVERIVALTLIGNQYREAKNTSQAIVYYRNSLEIARAEKNPGFELINLNQIGSALEESGDAAGALEQYQLGLKLAANDNERADSHGRIAAANSLLGQHDKAIEHQLKAMLFEERAGDFNHYAHANIELGRVCLVAQRYADAEKWLGKFLGTITEAGDSYWQAKARYMLARVKSAKGAGNEAKEQFTLARNMASKLGAEQLLKEIIAAESVPSATQQGGPP
jgi:tetratricopeptide (TPR) repeat protein